MQFPFLKTETIIHRREPNAKLNGIAANVRYLYFVRLQLLKRTINTLIQLIVSHIFQDYTYIHLPFCTQFDITHSVKNNNT